MNKIELPICGLTSCNNTVKRHSSKYCSYTCSNLARYSDVEYKEKHRTAIVNSYTPELLQKRSENALKQENLNLLENNRRRLNEDLEFEWYRKDRVERVKDLAALPKYQEIRDSNLSRLISRNTSLEHRRLVSESMKELWKAEYKLMSLAIHNNPYRTRDNSRELYFYVIKLNNDELKIGAGDFRRVNRYRYELLGDNLLKLFIGTREILEEIEFSIMQEYFTAEYNGKRLSHTGHTEVVDIKSLDKILFITESLLNENKIKEIDINEFDESVRLGSAIKSQLHAV